MNHNSLGCEQPYITHMRPRCKNGSHVHVHVHVLTTSHGRLCTGQSGADQPTELYTCLHDLHNLCESVHVFSAGKEPLQHENTKILVHITAWPSHHLQGEHPYARNVVAITSTCIHTLYKYMYIHVYTCMYCVALQLPLRAHMYYTCTCTCAIHIHIFHVHVQYTLVYVRYAMVTLDKAHLGKLFGEFEGRALEAEIVSRRVGQHKAKVNVDDVSL